MLVKDALNKMCPFRNVNCDCSNCMSWIYTKTNREYTEQEYNRKLIYDKEITKLLEYAHKSAFSYGIKEIIDREKPSIDALFKDILNINLELEEKEKDGYCILLKENKLKKPPILRQVAFN